MRLMLRDTFYDEPYTIESYLFTRNRAHSPCHAPSAQPPSSPSLPQLIPLLLLLCILPLCPPSLPLSFSPSSPPYLSRSRSPSFSNSLSLPILWCFLFSPSLLPPPALLIPSCSPLPPPASTFPSPNAHPPSSFVQPSFTCPPSLPDLEIFRLNLYNQSAEEGNITYYIPTDDQLEDPRFSWPSPDHSFTNCTAATRTVDCPENVPSFTHPPPRHSPITLPSYPTLPSPTITYHTLTCYPFCYPDLASCLPTSPALNEVFPAISFFVIPSLPVQSPTLFHPHTCSLDPPLPPLTSPSSSHPLPLCLIDRPASRWDRAANDSVL